MRVVKLGKCISLSSGKFLPQKNMNLGKHKVYGGNGVNGTHDEFTVEHETLIIGRVGAYCGCVHITEPKSWITDNALYITEFKTNVDIKYLYYLLNYKNLNQYANTSGQPSVSQSSLLEIEIPIVEVRVQKIISSILDKAQQLIDSRKEQIQLCDELIKSQFIEMFGDILNNTKGWETKQLSEICELKSGGTPSRQNPEYFTGDIPWVTTVALGKVSIDEDDAVEYITEEAIAKSATKLIPANSLLFGTRVGVGKISINKVPMCTNQDIVAIVGVNENEYNQVFLKKVIDSYSEYFNQQKRGATIQGIKGETLKSIAIPSVAIELQNQFARFVQHTNKLKFEMEKSLVELENNFNSLMQRAFKGELF